MVKIHFLQKVFKQWSSFRKKLLFFSNMHSTMMIIRYLGQPYHTKKLRPDSGLHFIDNCFVSCFIRIGKDDTVSEITSKFDVHILFSKSQSSSSRNNVTTEACPSSQLTYDKILEKSLRNWSDNKRDIFRVNLVSGNAKVSGSGQGVMLSQVNLTLTLL